MSYIKKETAINRLEGLVESAEKYDTPACLNALRDALAELCDVPIEKEVVKVVRCRNCAHYTTEVARGSISWCCRHERITYASDFCSDGEPTEGAE